MKNVYFVKASEDKFNSAQIPEDQIKYLPRVGERVQIDALEYDVLEVVHDFDTREVFIYIKLSNEQKVEASSVVTLNCDEGVFATYEVPNQIASRKEGQAEWHTWYGWKGTHDKRIEGSICSRCAFKHPTVYGSLDKLYKICPSCKSDMVIRLEG